MRRPRNVDSILGLMQCAIVSYATVCHGMACYGMVYMYAMRNDVHAILGEHWGIMRSADAGKMRKLHKSAYSARFLPLPGFIYAEGQFPAPSARQARQTNKA